MVQDLHLSSYLIPEILLFILKKLSSQQQKKNRISTHVCPMKPKISLTSLHQWVFLNCKRSELLRSLASMRNWFVPIHTVSSDAIKLLFLVHSSLFVSLLSTRKLGIQTMLGYKYFGDFCSTAPSCQLGCIEYTDNILSVSRSGNERKDWPPAPVC